MSEKKASSGSKLYSYDGCVMVWDRVDPSKFKARTYACSMSKAKNNIAHQYRRKCNLANFVKITLLDEVAEVE